MNTIAQAMGFNTFLELVVALVMAVYAAVVWPWIQRQLKRAGIEVEQQQAAVIEKALKGAVTFSAELAMQHGLDVRNPEARKQMAAAAADYVRRRVPDALKALGLDKDDTGLSDLIWSRLPTPDGAPTAPVRTNAPLSLPPV